MLINRKCRFMHSVDMFVRVWLCSITQKDLENRKNTTRIEGYISYVAG